jgi:hypothetical protein
MTTFWDAIPDTSVDEGLLDFIDEFAHALLRPDREFAEKLRHQTRPLSRRQGARLDLILGICLRARGT